MGNLYSDNLKDKKAYTDEEILKDVRGLVNTGQREGATLDYKRDISEKDNWPETVAAFANSFGGLVIFGVEGKGDQPRRISGFDPRGIEVQTKLGSTILSRIQPHPEFQVRVVTYDEDPSKEELFCAFPKAPTRLTCTRKITSTASMCEWALRKRRRTTCNFPLFLRSGADPSRAHLRSLLILLDRYPTSLFRNRKIPPRPAQVSTSSPLRRTIAQFGD